VWGVLLGYWVLGGGTRSLCFNSGYHDLGLLSQPEDGPHIGPKHVVVFLLYY